MVSSNYYATLAITNEVESKAADKVESFLSGTPDDGKAKLCIKMKL